MKQYFSFTLLLSGFSEITTEIANAVYEAGCDDALLGTRSGKPYLAFDREAESLEDAVASAIENVEGINKELNIEVANIVNDDLEEDRQIWEVIRQSKKIQRLLALRQKQINEGEKPKGENWRKIYFGK